MDAAQLQQQELQGGLPEAAAAAAQPSAPERGKPGRKPRPPVCQVPGCSTDLASLKVYYRRYRICMEHCYLPSMLLNGMEQRFCQACGRFHPLGEFEGDKRSCQRKLQRHNERRSNHNMAGRGKRGRGRGSKGGSRQRSSTNTHSSPSPPPEEPSTESEQEPAAMVVRSSGILEPLETSSPTGQQVQAQAAAALPPKQEPVAPVVVPTALRSSPGSSLPAGLLQVLLQQQQQHQQHHQHHQQQPSTSSRLAAAGPGLISSSSAWQPVQPSQQPEPSAGSMNPGDPATSALLRLLLQAHSQAQVADRLPSTVQRIGSAGSVWQQVQPAAAPLNAGAHPAVCSLQQQPQPAAAATPQLETLSHAPLMQTLAATLAGVGLGPQVQQLAESQRQQGQQNSQRMSQPSLYAALQQPLQPAPHPAALQALQQLGQLASMWPALGSNGLGPAPSAALPPASSSPALHDLLPILGGGMAGGPGPGGPGLSALQAPPAEQPPPQDLQTIQHFLRQMRNQLG